MEQLVDHLVHLTKAELYRQLINYQTQVLKIVALKQLLKETPGSLFKLQ